MAIEPTRLDRMEGSISNIVSHALQVDASGDAVAVWSASEAACTDPCLGGFYGSAFSPAHGWSGRVEVPTAGVSASYAEIASDTRGNFWVGWVETHGPGLPRDIKFGATHYNSTAGWGPASIIGTSPFVYYGPILRFDSTGDGVAAWVTATGDPYSLHMVAWAAHYQAAAGWETPVRLAPASYANDSFPLITTAGRGGFTVLWASGEVGAWTGFTRDFARGQGWGEAARMVAPAWYGFGITGAATAHDGSLLVIFSGYESRDAFGQTLAWNRRSPEGSWSTPETLAAYEDAYEDAPVLSSLATSDDGRAVLVWQQGHSWYVQGGPPPKGPHVLARVFDPQAGWSSPQQLDDGAGWAWEPRVLLAPTGRAFAWWSENPQAGKDRPVVKMAIASSEGHWSGPSLLMSNGDADVFVPNVGMDADGNLIATFCTGWYIKDTLWAVRYPHQATESNAPRFPTYANGRFVEATDPGAQPAFDLGGMRPWMGAAGLPWPAMAAAGLVAGALAVRMRLGRKPASPEQSPPGTTSFMDGARPPKFAARALLPRRSGPHRMDHPTVLAPGHEEPTTQRRRGP